MNTHPIKHSFLLLIALLFIMTGCRDRVTKTFTANVPDYVSVEDWRNTTFEMSSPQQLHRPGKIYIKDQYLFVNEIMKGIHFFDNSNPANPVNIGFLPIHANMDIAIKGQNLYADSYYDVLVFDIGNINQPQLVSRMENVRVFDKYGMMEGYNLNFPVSEVDPNQGVVMGWTVKEITVKNSDRFFYKMQDDAILSEMGFSGDGGTNFPAAAGIGGSMAAFTVYDNFLYTIEDWELDVFSIAGTPTEVASITLDRQAETLWEADGNLFIGMTTGMQIYSLADPGNPSYVAEFAHVNSCDPVVVDGDKAFVTLSSGNTCWDFEDRLDVIDLSNISNPELLYSYQLTNPKGLGVDGNLLFLCDGKDGLKVYDKSNLAAITSNMKAHFTGMTAHDVIPFNNLLILTGKEGIFQYDYSNANNIYELSHIQAF